MPWQLVGLCDGPNDTGVEKGGKPIVEIARCLGPYQAHERPDVSANQHQRELHCIVLVQPDTFKPGRLKPTERRMPDLGVRCLVFRCLGFRSWIQNLGFKSQGSGVHDLVLFDLRRATGCRQ